MGSPPTRHPSESLTERKRNQRRPAFAVTFRIIRETHIVLQEDEAVDLPSRSTKGFASSSAALGKYG